jgi:hypothetical protein
MTVTKLKKRLILLPGHLLDLFGYVQGVGGKMTWLFYQLFQT